MDLLLRQHSWCGTPVDRAGWIDGMSTIGMSCRFDSSYSGPSTACCRRAEDMLIGRFELAGQTLSPIPRAAGHWTADEIRLIVIRSGSMSVEQNGQALLAGPGDVVLTDPSFAFKQSFREPTALSIVRMTKTSLRARGLAHRLHAACATVPICEDVTAVRELVLNLTAQVGKASESLLKRMSMQCLDLMDVFLKPGHLALTRRSGATVASLARQAIARRIGDASLDVPSLAADVNVSPSCVSRALQAEGLSVMRYAYMLRIAHAGRLLSEAPDVMIRNVADQCGFLNAAHFSRAFKAHHGVTPREFARQCRASRAPNAREPLRGSMHE